MYTLGKAKQDIDLVAKHATEMAGHLIEMNGSIDKKLESFKTDILSAIDAKFADLARTIQGDTEHVESSAVSDLGAKVSLLMQGPPLPEPQDEPSHDETPHRDDASDHEPQHEPQHEAHQHQDHY